MVVVSRILVCPKQDSCVSSFSLPDGLLISREFLLLGVCFLSKGEGFAVLALWGQLFGHKIRRSVRAMIITPLPWNHLYLKPSVLAFPFFCHLAPIFSSLSTYIYMPFNKKTPKWDTKERDTKSHWGKKKKASKLLLPAWDLNFKLTGVLAQLSACCHLCDPSPANFLLAERNKINSKFG